MTTEVDSGDDSEDDGKRPQQDDEEDDDTAGQESAVSIISRPFTNTVTETPFHRLKIVLPRQTPSWCSPLRNTLVPQKKRMQNLQKNSPKSSRIRLPSRERLIRRQPGGTLLYWHLVPERNVRMITREMLMAKAMPLMASR